MASEETPQLPEPEWLDLSLGLGRALAVFADSDPAPVKLALLEAIHDGKIKTQGRRITTLAKASYSELESLPKSIWDPKLVRIGWEANGLGRVTGDQAYLFVGIRVKRRDLEEWLGQAAAPQKTSGEISETAPTVAAENVGEASATARTNEGSGQGAAYNAWAKDKPPTKPGPKSVVRRNAAIKMLGDLRSGTLTVWELETLTLEALRAQYASSASLNPVGDARKEAIAEFQSSLAEFNSEKL